MTKRIVVLAAGLSQPSSTRLLADRLAASVGTKLDAEIQVFELRDTAQDVTNNMLTGYASPRLQLVLDAVTSADGIIAVTPIFTTSYSGLFKSFMDVIDPSSLNAMPVLIAATGGTERHSLALDYAMRPLFAYLHAVVATTGVYAASSDWGSDDAGALADRIDRAAAEFSTLVNNSERSSLVQDPFALPAGFSPVGAFSAQ
jgi:FMN reductase